MPRRLGIMALSFWPGLPQIWTGQELLGLILAAIFAVTLNLALVTQFIWTEALAVGWPGFFASLAAMVWLVAAGYTSWWLWRCHPERHRGDIDRLFREATEHYLQGRWSEARLRFEQILAMDDTDADALMQLGTLLLRAEQPLLARRAFRQCLELEGGGKWRWEIGQVLSRLQTE